ncbi:hypothetical protein E2C01_021234 [Portunus trituberculatus]|uniref:Uncharacterized protein n=1 Tax=Portunus trituberculatus TaxID=210409 RepID=A0A5B7E256_PORTR|nr:hypothetical protein [Portunus trituberculatus]
MAAVSSGGRGVGTGRTRLDGKGGERGGGGGREGEEGGGGHINISMALNSLTVTFQPLNRPPSLTSLDTSRCSEGGGGGDGGGGDGGGGGSGED